MDGQQFMKKHTGFDLQELNVSEILQFLEFKFFLEKVYRQTVVMDPKREAEKFSEVDEVQSSRNPKSYRQNDNVLWYDHFQQSL